MSTFGTKRAAEQAGELQRGVIGDEYRQLDDPTDDYSDLRANQAVIHARQDLVLIYSMMNSLHDQAVITNRMLTVCAVSFLILSGAVLFR